MTLGSSQDLAVRMAELARQVTDTAGVLLLAGGGNTTSQTAGALNIFGVEPNAFDSEAEGVGSVLAAPAAAAILASRQGEQLRSALTNRDVIGQAKGIIMERVNVDAVRAFEMLRERSQTGNVKLVDVARQVLETRGDG